MQSNFMGLLEAVTILAAFLCSLVAGFLFAFAVVAMPGIRTLDARAFVRAFQAMDRVIQNNQPLFIVVWVGSLLAVLVAAVLTLLQGDAAGRLLVGTAALAYVLGVQLPTATINIPLNNEIQRVDVETVGDAAAQEARDVFEGRWNRWNSRRTVVACLVAGAMLMQLYRL